MILMSESLTNIMKLLAVVSFALFAFLFGNEADEIDLSDLLILLSALSAILLVQGATLILVSGIARALSSERIAAITCKALAIAFFVANAYYTSFITFEGSAQTKVLLAAGVGLIFAAILFRTSFQKPALFLAAAYVCLSFGLYAYTRIVMAHAAPTATQAPTIQNPRNVYLIGFESLHSPKAFREIYRANELPHVDWLRQHNFRVLDRAYSADIATLQSYSRIFEFGRPVSLEDVRLRTVFRTNNSTFRTFSQSDYSTQFLYKSTMFQVNPAFVTFAFPQKAFYQCDNLPAEYFYFICRAPVVSLINGTLFKPQPLWKTLLARIDAAAASKKPWFTFYHHAYPFHSNFYYTEPARFEPFKARMRDALPKILKHHENIIGHILTKDPNAIIVAIGDHGAHMTLGLPPDQPNDSFTAEQTLEDQYGAMLAIHPADFCRSRIFEGSSTVHLMQSIILCLNGNDDPTPAELEMSKTVFWSGKPISLNKFFDASEPSLPQFPRTLPPRK